ncbi:hypothetical protein JSE7799_02544 [Jannaschia seosinensis]|uniref:Methyl-accepting transducer domain-containing protein n=1 Tax=Jannaschia seosinensis TaxID=313367 RepID=A0A0M7BES6_9RHOB|nr:hypothetical protein [Jannaschia seosinensis]CUH39816.1 hypothetical protein JSE7799_02544 [Jannaschia seosinensis]
MISHLAPPFRETLGRLASDISGAFSVAFFEAEVIRNTAEEFDSDVSMLLAAAATDGAAGERGTAFAVFLENASSASSAAEEAVASLTDRAFQGALVEVSGSLRDMAKCTAELTTISSLTKITQTELRGAGDRLAAFVDSLDGQCRELQQTTARSADLIVETQRQSGFARDELVDIAREFQALSDGAGRKTVRLARLEHAHHVYTNLVREDASRLGEGVQSAVRDLISCLQFPDAFAQRMEHVQMIFDAMENGPDVDRSALAAVAAAQLGSMAEALIDVCSTANLSLVAINAILGENLLADGGKGGANPSDMWMSATTQENQMMLDSVAGARDQLGKALTLLSGLTGQIERTQNHLQASVRLNRELETSVHNASLVAHRSGSANSPLRFLAGSVKDVVGRTSDLMVRIGRSLTYIRSTSEALATSGLSQDLETLLELQAVAVQEADIQSKVVERIRSTRQQLLGHSGRLAGAATAGKSAFGAAADYAAELANLARRVQGPSLAAPENRNTTSDFDWLYQVYTMEEERSVHRKALGLKDPPSAGVVEEEDMSDFLL